MFLSLCFSAVIGLLYPCLDHKLGEELRCKREWSSVMRCVAVFVGINHASAVSFFTLIFILDQDILTMFRILYSTDNF